MSDNVPLEPTYKGFIRSTMDSLILFEAALTGRLPHISRRPHDRERSELIASGHVFIYEERSSGIKRWTDGVSWSPSRILGNFLLYRELDKPFQPGEKKRAMKRRSIGVNRASGGANSQGSSLTLNGSNGLMAETERAFVGSLVDSYEFKQDGLIKKTISITYHNIQHHLVSYYTLDDVTNARLATPSMDEALSNVRPRHALLHCSTFRAPVDDQEFVGNNPRFTHMYPESSEFPPMMPGAPQYTSSVWAPTQPPYLAVGGYPYGQSDGSVYSYGQSEPAPYHVTGSSQASHDYDPEAMMQERHSSDLAAPSESAHLDYPPLHFDRSMGPGTAVINAYTLPGLPLPPSVVDGHGMFGSSGPSHTPGHGPNGYSSDATSLHNGRYDETHSNQNGDFHDALEASPFHHVPTSHHQVSDFESLPDPTGIFTTPGHHHAIPSSVLDLDDDSSSPMAEQASRQWSMAGGPPY